MVKKGFTSINQLMVGYEPETDKQRRISREWQDYAYRLAVELDDTEHTSLYMRLVKNTPRFLLEEARIVTKASVNAKSKGRLFMWKLKQLKDGLKEKTQG